MTLEIDNNTLTLATAVSKFMMSLADIDPERYDSALKDGYPFGDLAYAAALNQWMQNGRPDTAIFSYAKGETECPMLLAFREEISTCFGLPIMTIEESIQWRNAQDKIIEHKVHDWGRN